MGKKIKHKLKEKKSLRRLGLTGHFGTLRFSTGENYTNPKKAFELTLMNITLL